MSSPVPDNPPPVAASPPPVEKDTPQRARVGRHSLRTVNKLVAKQRDLHSKSMQPGHYLGPFEGEDFIERFMPTPATGEADPPSYLHDPFTYMTNEAQKLSEYQLIDEFVRRLSHLLYIAFTMEPLERMFHDA